MTAPLQGTAALVTGATSGIGRSVAVTLASLGATVAVVGRREDRLQHLCEELADEHCLPIAADLTDRDAARDAVSTTVERFGRLDVLVNAAGVMLNGPSLGADLDDWDAMVDVNLQGLMYVTKAALPHLVRAAGDEPRRVADVVNVSSIAGRFANRNVAVYNATKFGVTAMSDVVQDSWIAFIRSGDPSTTAVGAWATYDGDRRPTMLLGREPHVVHRHRDPQLAVWDGRYPASG